MNIRKKELFFTALTVVALFSVIMIILEIPKIERDLKNNVKENMVRTISSVVDNYDNTLRFYASQHPDQTLDTILKHNPHLRHELESALSMIVSDDIKYIYVLYRDDTHKFRFMLDGSKQEKAVFGQKFDIESQAWERSYQTKTPQLIEQ